MLFFAFPLGGDTFEVAFFFAMGRPPSSGVALERRGDDLNAPRQCQGDERVAGQARASMKSE
jgi:hypothetical protein